jgi:hypothetical protein
MREVIAQQRQAVASRLTMSHIDTLRRVLFG